MDLLWLALADDLGPETFVGRVLEVWAAESVARPCALLLNHPLASADTAWRDLFTAAMSLALARHKDLHSSAEASAASVAEMREHIEIRQLASACVCCAPQGQLGLVLAGMFRRLRALSTHRGESNRSIAVLLVGPQGLKEANLRRGIRYLQPPPQLKHCSSWGPSLAPPGAQLSTR